MHDGRSRTAMTSSCLGVKLKSRSVATLSAFSAAARIDSLINQSAKKRTRCDVMFASIKSIGLHYHYCNEDEMSTDRLSKQK